MKDPHLTLEQKVGQLFVLGFPGREPDDDVRDLLDAIQPGGFVIHQRNIDSFDQIYELTNGLRELSSIPPLLATEHEGGRIDRLKNVFTMMPSMAELANAGMAQLRIGARIIAAELEATGLNLVLAPVADLRMPGSIFAERSLGSRPDEVARLASALIEELSKRGVSTCAKHFPGLGGATVDPHFALPRIERPKRQLLQEDVAPFVQLFGQADMVMISPAYYQGFGDEVPLPACLSSRVVENFLRKKLGYKGLTITDDLTMGAVSSVGLTPELFLQAFEAGNDLLLFSQTTPLVERAFKTIVSAARKSEVLRQRVDESVERILALKDRIEFTPLRYRAHLRARITRQIERLRKSVVEVAPPEVTV